MPRALTSRGLRSLSADVQLPREVRAASAMANRIKSRGDILASELRPSGIREIVDEEFASVLMDLSIRRDPHVSMHSRMYWLLSDGGVTVPDGADFFKDQAAGVATTGVAGVEHNLLDDRKPLKPCMIHNIGIGVFIASDSGYYPELDSIMTRAQVKLKRDKESIFEFPLSQACTNIILIDTGATPVNTTVDIEPLSSGGIEVEGHGAPFLLTDAISLELDFMVPGEFQDLAAVGGIGSVVLTARVDGEVME